MKIKLVLALILVYFPSSMVACDCSPITLQNSFVQKSYYKSDIVFLGIVESKGKESITFSIVEILKGQYHKSTLLISNKGSCSIVFNKDEVWLIYSEKQRGEYKFLTSMCLPNRNYGIISPLEVAPPPLGEEESLYNSFEKHKEILLANELNGLRQKKILNEIKNIKKEYKLIQYEFLIIGALVLILIFIFFIRKKQ